MRKQRWEQSGEIKPPRFAKKSDTNLRLQAERLAKVNRMDFEDTLADFEQTGGWELVGVVASCAGFWAFLAYVFLA